MMEVETLLGSDVHQVKLGRSELNLHATDTFLFPEFKVILELFLKAGLIREQAC